MTHTKIYAKALLYDGDKVLILKRSETAVRGPLEWDLPGGKVEDGEEVDKAVCREILEEIGLTINEADLQLSYASAKMWKGENICRLFYIAKSPSTEITLSDEHYQSKWVSLDEAVEAITYDVQEEVLRYIRDNDLLPKG